MGSRVSMSMIRMSLPSGLFHDGFAVRLNFFPFESVYVFALTGSLTDDHNAFIESVGERGCCCVAFMILHSSQYYANATQSATHLWVVSLTP